MLNRFNPFAKKFVTSKVFRVSLESTIKLDTLEIELASDAMNPIFVIPDDVTPFIVKGVSNVDGLDNFVIVYVEQGGHRYAFHFEVQGHDIISCLLYQECLQLFPQSETEWEKHFSDLTEKTLTLDGFCYEQTDGDAFTRSHEQVVAIKNVTYESQFKQFSRKTVSLMGEQERLLVVARSCAEQNSAAIIFYVGIDVHVSNISILGS